MDNTFWATVALLIFAAIVIYFKIPGMLSKSLDERANNIRNELAEAKRLREEAKQLLDEFQRKRKEAEKDAADIVASAKREADMLLEEASARPRNMSRAAPPWPSRRSSRPNARPSTKFAPAPSTSPSRLPASCLPTGSMPSRAPSCSSLRFRK